MLYRHHLTKDEEEELVDKLSTGGESVRNTLN